MIYDIYSVLNDGFANSHQIKNKKQKHNPKKQKTYRNCQSKVTCPGWHHEGEKRRNPGEDPNFIYSEEPCPKFCAFIQNTHFRKI